MENALAEGKRYDEETTKLAESEINPAMLDEDGEEEEGSSRKTGNKKK